jgi:hypothetical protein
MSKHRKLTIVVITAIAVIAMLFLAASLSFVEFLPGEPFPFMELIRYVAIAATGPVPGGELILKVTRIIFGLSLALMPVWIVYMIFSPKARKEFLKHAIRYMPILLIFIFGWYLITRFSPPDLSGSGSDGQAPGLLPFNLPDGSGLRFRPPAWLIAILNASLVVFLVVLIVVLAWLLWKQYRQERKPLYRLVKRAERALVDIQRGADLRNTVIRCYYEMTQVLTEQKGIRRGLVTTPSEFVTLLVEKGLPNEPVRQLTQLFEEVRYGAKVPGEDEERRAVNSLTAIVEACQGL